MSGDDRRGVMFIIATMAVFAAQDGVSKLLALDYSPVFIVAVRYWAFAVFVVILSSRRPGGLKAAIRTRHPVRQCVRGVLLVIQICIITFSFAQLGLAETHAVMASYPLIIAALSGLVLGERVTTLTWISVGVGFVGVVTLLRPGVGVFDPYALLPLLGALMFATYGLLTRIVSRDDAPSVSFFYTGVAGAASATFLVPFFWTPLVGTDWIWMAILCVTGAGGHYLFIRAYEVSEAAKLQPFAYLQLVFVSIIGVSFFAETLDAWILTGAALVVFGGLVMLLGPRLQRRARLKA